MITIKHPVSVPDTYPLERIGPLHELLFFDIETTGFSGDTSQLYLIGCTYHDGFGWKMIQWFADTRQAERELLTAFFTFMERFRYLVHFNGDGFDIPYLLKCCKRLGLPYNFDAIESIDIYKKIRPYRHLLGLESMKQKAIESFLGIRRTDTYSGGELISFYKDYLKTCDETAYDLLILHNEDDLKGMPKILPILNYPDLFSADWDLTSQELCQKEDGSSFLHLCFETPVTIPVPLSFEQNIFSLEAEENHISCMIALYQGTLKYFYPNYKDYYYLPFEDTAIHKSVGEYVDRSARKKATARTCYTKKEGFFLPSLLPSEEPSFKEDFDSDLTYILFHKDCPVCRETACAYAKELFLMSERRGRKKSDI